MSPITPRHMPMRSQSDRVLWHPLTTYHSSLTEAVTVISQGPLVGSRMAAQSTSYVPTAVLGGVAAPVKGVLNFASPHHLCGAVHRRRADAGTLAGAGTTSRMPEGCLGSRGDAGTHRRYGSPPRCAHVGHGLTQRAYCRCSSGWSDNFPRTWFSPSRRHCCPTRPNSPAPTSSRPPPERVSLHRSPRTANWSVVRPFHTAGRTRGGRAAEAEGQWRVSIELLSSLEDRPKFWQFSPWTVCCANSKPRNFISRFHYFPFFYFHRSLSSASPPRLTIKSDDRGDAGQRFADVDSGCMESCNLLAARGFDVCLLSRWSCRDDYGSLGCSVLRGNAVPANSLLGKKENKRFLKNKPKRGNACLYQHGPLE